MGEKKRTVENDDKKKLDFLLRAHSLVIDYGFDGEDFIGMLVELFQVVDEEWLFANICLDSELHDALPRKKLIALAAGFLSILSCDEAYAALRYSREEWWNEPLDEDEGHTDREKLLKLIQDNEGIPAKNRFKLPKSRY